MNAAAKTERDVLLTDCEELRELAKWFERRKDGLNDARTATTHTPWLRDVADRFERLVRMWSD